jgi:hypothetical protein
MVFLFVLFFNAACPSTLWAFDNTQILATDFAEHDPNYYPTTKYFEVALL